jgi:hypothetical protein
MKEAVTVKYDTSRPTYVQAPKSSSESLLATISEKARPERRLPILTAKATKPVNLRPGRLVNRLPPISPTCCYIAIECDKHQQQGWLPAVLAIFKVSQL